eukprot:gene2361-2592_t
MAAGSGIPEVKCYLNGLSIPRLLEMKTLICKAIGIIFACSAGLPLGKEGPMVHIGAIVAAGISQGKSATLGVETTFSNFQDLRNDREKRDFVACGSASGVAAAFGAPIGGVLFSLEEGASFWSTRLTWRCFFCAMTTVFFLFLFNTAKSLFGHSDITAMFSFGEFFSLQGEQANYSVWELSLFVGMGYLGGLIGAFFNLTVNRLFLFRKQYVQSTGRRCLEILSLVCLMSILSMVLPLLWSKCTPLPVNMEGWTDEEKSLVADLHPLYCNAETHYNELASLYLTDSDTAIRQLFHFREVGDHNDSTFSSDALFLYFLFYLIMACLIVNTATPAGLFVPSLLSGAAFGRLFGHLLHKLDNTRGTFADSGTYALMGAAAISSGITRMTISLTVMILEATGDMQYVLPLMLIVLTARLVGNIFTEGIYDMHIHSRSLAFLDEDENYGQQVEFHDLTVADIMTIEVMTLPSIVTVGQALDTLARGGHHCFPIVDDNEPGILQGSIARKVLCTLLKHRAFSPLPIPIEIQVVGEEGEGEPHDDCSSIGGGGGGGTGENGSSRPPTPTSVQGSRLSPLVNWGTLECIYPNYPDIDDIPLLSQTERGYWLDLRPYLDSAPYLVTDTTSLPRSYRMFRTLGLRQLLVVDKSHRLVGIVTRSDFLAINNSILSQRLAIAQQQHGHNSNREEEEECLVVDAEEIVEVQDDEVLDDDSSNHGRGTATGGSGGGSSSSGSRGRKKEKDRITNNDDSVPTSSSSSKSFPSLGMSKRPPRAKKGERSPRAGGGGGGGSGRGLVQLTTPLNSQRKTRRQSVLGHTISLTISDLSPIRPTSAPSSYISDGVDCSSASNAGTETESESVFDHDEEEEEEEGQEPIELQLPTRPTVSVSPEHVAGNEC